MELSWAQGILEWLAAHPGWATLLVFAIALSEGVVGAGMLVPGATLLFIAGALVGTGHLGLGPTLIASFLGALVGDTISYWLGRHYGDRLRTYWPLRRYPGALARGDAFFAAHGGKSLVLGRFIGPIRGVIPAVAGMMNMPLRAFLVVNVLSALAWAPAYLLPGLVFGASLAVAASVALRLVALLLLSVFGAWAAWWLVRWLIAPRLRRAAALIAWRARHWGRIHPVAARALMAPRHALRAFSYGVGWIWWAALVVLSILILRQGWWGGPTLVDEALFAILEAEVAAAVRSGFLVPALLYEPWVWVPAWLAGVAWVIRRGRLRVAAVLGTIVPGGVALALLLGWASGNLDGAALYRGAPVLAFPSPALAGFTTLVLAAGVLATVVYGSLRRPVQFLGVAIPLLAALGGVVAGELWLTDAIGGVLLGVVMAGLVVLARSASLQRPPERSLPAVVALILVVAVLARATVILPEAYERRGITSEPPQLSVHEWLTVGPEQGLGRELRWLDGGQRPVDVQWLARPREVAARLAHAGWHEPERGLHGALRWLQPTPELERLAPAPRWYRGRLPGLVRVLPREDGRRLVLRLWSAPVRLPQTAAQLWLGSLEVERVQAGWPVTVVRSRAVTASERAQVVTGMQGPEDLRVLVPAQPVRVLPVRYLWQAGRGEGLPRAALRRPG
ncbi:MAG: VTT domain-containing protein [Halorhodospira sp.]